MEWFKGLALWFGSVALAVILGLAICPRLMTGSYADITIDRISVDKNGQYSVGISELTAKGTEVIEGFYDGTHYNGGGRGGNDGLFGWPSQGSAGVMFTLDPESTTERRATRPRPERLLVKTGDTRRVRAGQRFYLFDFETADGIRHYGFVEVEPYSGKYSRTSWHWPKWP